MNTKGSSFRIVGCSVSVSVLLLGGCHKKSVVVGEASPSPFSTQKTESAGNNPAAQEAHSKLSDAIQAQLGRKYEESLALFEEAKKLDPMLKGVDYQMAVSAFNLGDEARTEKYAYATIAANDSGANAYNLLGTLYARRGDYPAAEWAFAQGIALNPADPIPLYNLSEALRAQGRSVEAMDRLREAIQRNPGEPLYALKLRLAKIEAGQSIELIPDVDRELALKPPAGDWLMTAAAIALKADRFGEAAALLASARGQMQPILFFGLIQEDPLFRQYKQQPQIAPFYDVTIAIKPPKESTSGTSRP